MVPHFLQIMKIKTIPTILAALLLAGCGTPMAQFARTAAPANPGKVQFLTQGGTYATISIYKDPVECKGIQRLAFFSTGVNDTIYVPYDKYFTFSIHANSSGAQKYAIGMYSVPFNSGEMRVNISYGPDAMHTSIEVRDQSSGWRAASGVVKRQVVTPFLESGAWCTPSAEIS
ncbi:hypothetical protein [Chitinimonas koreensis]|uniref:hypothetical protein n=1 Tax=Chitinimonas koreensis TaxID=356302 RepID=UPI00048ABF2F|nr:hypothetical protein [Chitinimonas koreensis]QNM98190.1 hypothetical protein H9L41_08085 [Chitinimonas koreensis]